MVSSPVAVTLLFLFVNLRYKSTVAEKGHLFKKNPLPRLKFENRKLNLLIDQVISLDFKYDQN